jgi:hypothetical protein
MRCRSSVWGLGLLLVLLKASSGWLVRPCSHQTVFAGSSLKYPRASINALISPLEGMPGRHDASVTASSVINTLIMRLSLILCVCVLCVYVSFGHR